MQPAYHSGEAIARALTFEGLIEHLREAHRLAPPDVERVLMTQKTSDGLENGYLIWPAWQHDRNLGIKIVTVFPGNARPGNARREAGPPSIQALYLLFDGENGAPQAILDGTELTYWKTAADSALGADYLARGDAGTLLVVGAGALAPFMIRAHLSVRPGLRRVLVWNRTAAGARRMAEAWEGQPRPEAVAELEPAVREADIVCCVTSTTEPLIRGEWLGPGTHLDLVGGYTPEMREADDEACRRARIHVDSRWFTLRDCGDIAGPLASGAITEADVLGDLFELCRGEAPGRQNAEEITIFKNAGGGHLDLMTARHIAAQVG